MRAVAQTKLEEQFFLEDSIVRNLLVDTDSSSITLELLTPIFKGHAEYGGVLKKLIRYFSDGVYLNSDARYLTITFSGCKLKSKSEFDEDEDRASPISYWFFKTLETGAGTITMKADDVEVEFDFNSFSYKECKI